VRKYASRLRDVSAAASGPSSSSGFINGGDNGGVGAMSGFTYGPGSTTLEVGDFAKLDLGRSHRTGIPEVVWGPGKTPAQIVSIMEALRDRQSVVMATRITPEAEPHQPTFWTDTST